MLSRRAVLTGTASSPLAVVGRPVVTSRHGREITWRATRAGGLTLRVANAHGWVIYVGRLKLR